MAIRRQPAQARAADTGRRRIPRGHVIAPIEAVLVPTIAMKNWLAATASRRSA
jgi:hypothetical protein